MRTSHAVVAIAVGVAFLAGGRVGVAQKPATPAQTPPAPAKLLPPVKGLAYVEYTMPATVRKGSDVVTTFKIKNVSNGAIAGFRVDEYWWDKKRTAPLTGSTFRASKPLMPQEVVTVTLVTPFDSKMDSNNFEFRHANGKIKERLVKKLD